MWRKLADQGVNALLIPEDAGGLGASATELVIALEAIGRHAAGQGLPGLLYPAARWPDGSCLAAFRADPLSDPSLMYYLTYRIDSVAATVSVERTPGRVQVVLAQSELRRSG